MNIFILRMEKSLNETLGVLVVDNNIFSYTLELPYRDNQRNVSCIPSGEYDCEYINSPKFGYVPEVKNVEGRSNILIHTGNTKNDILGCILLGNKVGYLRDDRAVLESRNAFNKFKEKVTDNFKLYVLDLDNILTFVKETKNFIEKVTFLTKK